VSKKRVLVTGGSRGIGRAIALKLAEEGWAVAIHYGENETAARETEADLGSSASEIYRADLSIPTNAPKLWEQVLADGPVHAVVNNAGVYQPLSFLTDDESAFDHDFAHTFAVNFESPLRMTRAAARHFASHGGGKILNVASRVGFRGEAGAALYAASKAALINLTRSLAVELAPKNVGLFGIAPGWVETAMAREGMSDRLPDVLAGIPLGRMASPEDCAATAAFLLSESAAYLSGVVIDINGASYFH
jgi:3-oxoacyl-[acyl-carrier protein] reductase